MPPLYSSTDEELEKKPGFLARMDVKESHSKKQGDRMKKDGKPLEIYTQKEKKGGIEKTRSEIHQNTKA